MLYFVKRFHEMVDPLKTFLVLLHLSSLSSPQAQETQRSGFQVEGSFLVKRKEAEDSNLPPTVAPVS